MGSEPTGCKEVFLLNVEDLLVLRRFVCVCDGESQAGDLCEKCRDKGFSIAACLAGWKVTKE